MIRIRQPQIMPACAFYQLLLTHDICYLRKLWMKRLFLFIQLRQQEYFPLRILQPLCFICQGILPGFPYIAPIALSIPADCIAIE